jgi:hypothetical protein
MTGLRRVRKALRSWTLRLAPGSRPAAFLRPTPTPLELAEAATDLLYELQMLFNTAALLEDDSQWNTGWGWQSKTLYMAVLESFLVLLAPMSVRRREAEQAERSVTNESERPRRIVFRAVSVFDVSQTDGLPGTEPVSLESPCQPIQGDTHAHLLPALEQLAGELGYSVARRPLDGPADGWCDSHKHEIVINDELPANAQVRVLVHEIAHALGVGYSDYGRRRAEVLVDTVTFIVCGAVGLDTSGSSVPYVAGWGESGELDAIRGYAETIDEIARRIEDALA